MTDVLTQNEVALVAAKHLHSMGYECVPLGTLARLAEADALLRETRRDLRIAAKCMNRHTPVFRQFNDTADRIDAHLAREP